MLQTISRVLGVGSLAGSALTFGVGVWLPTTARHTIGNILYSMFALTILAVAIAAFDLLRDETPSKENKS